MESFCFGGDRRKRYSLAYQPNFSVKQRNEDKTRKEHAKKSLFTTTIDRIKSKRQDKLKADQHIYEVIVTLQNEPVPETVTPCQQEIPIEPTLNSIRESPTPPVRKRRDSGRTITPPPRSRRNSCKSVTPPPRKRRDSAKSVTPPPRTRRNSNRSATSPAPPPGSYEGSTDPSSAGLCDAHAGLLINGQSLDRYPEVQSKYMHDPFKPPIPPLRTPGKKRKIQSEVETLTDSHSKGCADLVRKNGDYDGGIGKGLEITDLDDQDNNGFNHESGRENNIYKGENQMTNSNSDMIDELISKNNLEDKKVKDLYDNYTSYDPRLNDIASLQGRDVFNLADCVSLVLKNCEGETHGKRDSYKFAILDDFSFPHINQETCERIVPNVDEVSDNYAGHTFENNEHESLMGNSKFILDFNNKLNFPLLSDTDHFLDETEAGEEMNNIHNYTKSLLIEELDTIQTTPEEIFSNPDLHQNEGDPSEIKTSPTYSKDVYNECIVEDPLSLSNTDLSDASYICKESEKSNEIMDAKMIAQHSNSEINSRWEQVKKCSSLSSNLDLRSQGPTDDVPLKQETYLGLQHHQMGGSRNINSSCSKLYSAEVPENQLKQGQVNSLHQPTHERVRLSLEKLDLPPWYHPKSEVDSSLSRQTRISRKELRTTSPTTRRDRSLPSSPLPPTGVTDSRLQGRQVPLPSPHSSKKRDQGRGTGDSTTPYLGWRSQEKLPTFLPACTGPSKVEEARISSQNLVAS